MKLVLREEIRKLKITEFTSPYEEMIKFVDEQFAVSLSSNFGSRKYINFFSGYIVIFTPKRLKKLVVLQQFKDMTSLQVSGSVRLSYKDDDGDEITVSSNREVQDALQSSGNVKILKFTVRDLKEESGSDNSEPNSPVCNVKEVGNCEINLKMFLSE